MRRTTVYLEPELEILLKAETRRQRRPMAELIREALHSYLGRVSSGIPPGKGVFNSGERDTAERTEELLEETGFGEES